MKPNINVKWSFIGNIFVNFELLYNESENFRLDNMNCITSDFASVNSENKLEMHKILNQIHN